MSFLWWSHYPSWVEGWWWQLKAFSHLHRSNRFWVPSLKQGVYPDWRLIANLLVHLTIEKKQQNINSTHYQCGFDQFCLLLFYVVTLFGNSNFLYGHSPVIPLIANKQQLRPNRSFRNLKSPFFPKKTGESSIFSAFGDTFFFNGRLPSVRMEAVYWYSPHSIFGQVPWSTKKIFV